MGFTEMATQQNLGKDASKSICVLPSCNMMGLWPVCCCHGLHGNGNSAIPDKAAHGCSGLQGDGVIDSRACLSPPRVSVCVLVCLCANLPPSLPGQVIGAT